MTTITTPARTNLAAAAKPRSLRGAWRQIRQGWQLYLLLLLPVVWLLIFMYYPMYGAQIAFRDFLPGKSITGSEWIGLENFTRFFNSPMFMRLMKNTLWLSLYSLVVGFPIPILLALSLNQLQTGFFKRTVQMVSYAPYFISTVVMVGLLLNFLDLRRGPVNLFLMQLGLDPIQFMGSAELFPSVYVWSGVWQNTGFATIIYLAALTTVDPSLHEAAVVDGANRLQRIWHIDIPSITPVIVTLFILNMGQLLNIGFEKTYLMQNQLNLATSEVISTYVYKTGLAGGIANFSYAAAIGLFNSVIGLVLLVSANWAANRLTNKGLF
ncbi:MAG: putative multiple-sugar transport system permease YteP [Chloroflexi bacterium ADurb.Bin325]|nr:MAG: putative multiple-sugar transport system permease YteP [Chloroflexi bacterium ADurb.Bin325]